jgi:hypothetical protein
VYEVPEYLYAEWFSAGRRYNFKWLVWFLILAQGGSLRRLGQYVPSIEPEECKVRRYCHCLYSAENAVGWSVAKGFQQHLFGLPDNIHTLAAVIMATVKSMGGTENDALRLVRNEAYIIDPTDPVYPLYGTDTRVGAEFRFWNETVNWIIRHADEMEDDESQLILNWARHAFTENRDFSWRGRSVQASLLRAQEYQRSLEVRKAPKVVWEGMDHQLDWHYKDDTVLWEINEITNSDALYKEGRAMSHCVGSYVHRCTSQRSAIFSLTRNKKRRLTIEIKPETGKIVQAHGKANRAAKKQEDDILWMWYNHCVRPVLNNA